MSMLRFVGVLLIFVGHTTVTGSKSSRSFQPLESNTFGSRTPLRSWHHHFPAASVPHPPAFLQSASEKVKGALAKLKEGTIELFDNTKNAIGVWKRYKAGEPISFKEYNLMSRTTEDCTKLVQALIWAKMSPEFAIFIPFYFPGLIPSTYDTPEGRMEKLEKKNLVKAKAVVESVLKLQDAAERGEKKLKDPNPPLLQKLLTVLEKEKKGKAAALKEMQPILLTSEKHTKKITADLRSVPRPMLVTVGKSVGLFASFVPSFLLRFMIKDYLTKVRQGDEVLSSVNLKSLSRGDLFDACSKRNLPLSPTQNDDLLRGRLQEWLNLVYDNKIVGADQGFQG